MTNIKLKTNKENTVIEVRANYYKDGYNYNTPQRGYYVSVSPIKEEVINGVRFQEYQGFTGYFGLLRAVKRASKNEEKLADMITMAVAKPLIDRVCAEQGLTVID